MTNISQGLPVQPADIDSAAKVIAPFAVRTPLLSSPVLDERVGAAAGIDAEVDERGVEELRVEEVADDEVVRRAGQGSTFAIWFGGEMGKVDRLPRRVAS